MGSQTSALDGVVPFRFETGKRLGVRHNLNGPWWLADVLLSIEWFTECTILRQMLT